MNKPLPYFIFIILLALIFSGLISRPGNLSINSSVLNHEGDQFKWGAQISTYPLNLTYESFNVERVKKELNLVSKLGVRYCRFNLEFSDNVENKETTVFDDVNDQMVNLMIESGCQPVMVLEAGQRFNEGSPEDAYKIAYDRILRIAARYKGKVKYYQLLNEITGTSIWRPDDSGESLSDPYGYKYNKARFQRVEAWIKGFADAIVANDPAAKKIITGHWAWYTLLDYLVKDGFNCFDIIGWAWYSPDGTDLSQLKIGNIGQEFNINLVEELNKFGKEIWVIESNRHEGSFDTNGQGESEQAEFIKETLKNIYYHSNIKGYFVFPFMDVPPENNSKESDNEWGLVRVKKDQEGTYQFAQPKDAYWVYRDFILYHH